MPADWGRGIGAHARRSDLRGADHLPSGRNVRYCDGGKCVADKAGAYWLFDEIARAQRFEKSVAAEEFQLGVAARRLPFFASGADNHFVLGRRLFLSFFRSSPL
jgi:hypothetical protein